MPERDRALIVQSDAETSRAFAERLTAECFLVAEASSVSEAKAKAKINADKWDIAFVDLKLPDGGGYEVIQSLAARKTAGIVLLAECDTVEDRLEGYSRGADIYLIEPVSDMEIAAAAGAVLRRKRDAAWARQDAGWLLEPSASLLKAPNGSAIQLNEREFAFMQRVMDTPGKPVERGELQTLLLQNAETANSRSCAPRADILQHVLQ